MARTRTVVKMVKNLTKDEYRQCRHKNFGEAGSMQEDLEYCREKDDDNSKVILIKQADGNIIAWALVQFDFNATGANVYFWVEPDYRRKGLGARLLRASKKLDDRPFVFPHDSVSGKFFKKHLSDVRYAKWDEHWLTRA